MRGRARLDLTRDRLTHWRGRYGGPGIPVPEELWAEAVEVARVEGVGKTARVLRLDRLRLEARMGAGTADAADVAETEGRFVELDASRLGLSPRTLVRFQGRDGERLEVEFGAGTTIDIAALADLFWRRG